MTPFQYADSFHNLTVTDSRLGLNQLVKVTDYPDGTEWTEGSTASKEAVKVLSGVTRKPVLGEKGQFTIPNDSRVDPAELFNYAGVVRSFCGRGSPDEMKDSLRLAVLSGVCPVGSAASYGHKWFKQDCNAFVGNYLGLSPMLGIPAYALGLERMRGADPSQIACASVLPRQPRTSLSQVAPGDLLVTYGSPHPHHKWRWRHIALVESLTVTLIPTRTGDDKHGVPITETMLSIAEWGWNIEADHTVRDKKVTVIEDILKIDPAEYTPDKKESADWKLLLADLKLLLADLKAEMKNRKLVGFFGHDPSHKKAIRFFLEGFSPAKASHRGRHCNGKYGV